MVCVVVGTFKKVSLVLLDAMAAGRVPKLARTSCIQQGRHKVEIGIAQAQLRHWLITASLRAIMACMLDRVTQRGEGAALVSKRKVVTLALEERMERERETQGLSKLSGRNVSRKGHIYLQWRKDSEGSLILFCYDILVGL